ncbi:MAG: NAD(P)/FAD-dependent oxidoreductase, partial [Pseudomonadota bacterium]
PPKVRIGDRYRPGRLKPRYDSIIIGSGPGGLAAASTLAKMGQSVLVLEQHYTIGGGAHTYARAGFAWDIGIHFSNDMMTPGSPAKAVADFVGGGRMQWAEMSNEFVYRIGQTTYRLPILCGEQTHNWFKATFPDEAENFDRFVADYKRLARGMGLPMALQQLAPPGTIGAPVRRLARRLIPQDAVRPAAEQLRTYFKDENLIACITSLWIAFGVPPRDLPFFSVCGLSVGKNQLNYPDGGGAMIGQSLKDEIEAHGGDVYAYAKVEKILIERGRAVGVRMVDGSEVRSNSVISNAGARNTFADLLPKSLGQKLGYVDRLPKVRASMAHLNLFGGINASAEDLGLPDGEHIVDGSLDLDAALQDFGKDMEGAVIPNVFFAFPSMKDPSFRRAYPNKTTVSMIAFIENHRGFDDWKDGAWGQRGAEYQALKDRLSGKLLDVLYTSYPQLRGRLDFHELSTPLSTRHFLNAPDGEALGAAFKIDRFGVANWLNRKTKVPGLYLTGQDTLAMGFTPSLISGVLTAAAILNWRDKYKLFRILKAGLQGP